jgi:hypothetical protein
MVRVSKRDCPQVEGTISASTVKSVALASVYSPPEIVNQRTPSNQKAYSERVNVPDTVMMGEFMLLRARIGGGACGAPITRRLKTVVNMTGCCRIHRHNRAMHRVTRTVSALHKFTSSCTVHQPGVNNVRLLHRGVNSNEASGKGSSVGVGAGSSGEKKTFLLTYDYVDRMLERRESARPHHLKHAAAAMHGCSVLGRNLQLLCYDWIQRLLWLEASMRVI